MFPSCNKWPVLDGHDREVRAIERGRRRGEVCAWVIVGAELVIERRLGDGRLRQSSYEQRRRRPHQGRPHRCCHTRTPAGGAGGMGMQLTTGRARDPLTLVTLVTWLVLTSTEHALKGTEEKGEKKTTECGLSMAVRLVGTI